MKFEKIIGSWSLISWKTVYDNGRIIFPMGDDAQGHLIYSSDGYMYASLFKNNRKPFKTGEMLTATDYEKINAWDSYFSYSGRYSCKGNQIDHFVESSMYPNWLNDNQSRLFTLDGNILILETLPQKTKRGTQISRVSWERSSSK